MKFEGRIIRLEEALARRNPPQIKPYASFATEADYQQALIDGSLDGRRKVYIGEWSPDCWDDTESENDNASTE